MIRTTVIALALTGALALSGCGDNAENPGTGAKQELKTKAATAQTSDAPTTSPDPVAAPAPSPASAPATAVKRQPMTPADLASICEQCHDKDDVARYEETFLPLYTMMFRPAPWADPNVYLNTMPPVMDPETYARWYNQWTKVMGVPDGPGDQK